MGWDLARVVVFAVICWLISLYFIGLNRKSHLLKTEITVIHPQDIYLFFPSTSSSSEYFKFDGWGPGVIEYLIQRVMPKQKLHYSWNGESQTSICKGQKLVGHGLLISEHQINHNQENTLSVSEICCLGFFSCFILFVIFLFQITYKNNLFVTSYRGKDAYIWTPYPTLPGASFSGTLG